MKRPRLFIAALVIVGLMVVAGGLALWRYGGWSPYRQGLAPSGNPPQATATASSTPATSPLPTPIVRVTQEPTSTRPPFTPTPEGTPVVVVPGPGTPTPTPLFAADLPPDVVNVVLLGVDLRKPGQPWRTDTILLVSIDRWNRTVSLLSIPRDLWVYMPGVGYGRINTADFWGQYKKLEGGGPELLKQTIKHNLGIEVHRYARVDFKGFISIIDTLGGIRVDVDCPIRDPVTGFEIEPGVQHMDGKTALKYVQSRYTTSDLDRARRQQKVLRAIFEKVLSLNLLPNIPHLWKAITETVKTDLSLVEVITLAYFGARLRPEHLRARMLSYPAVRSWLGPGGAQVLMLNKEKFQKVRQDFLHPPDTTAEEEPEEATIEVLNGTEEETLTELAVADLVHRGFDAVAGGPADRQDHRATAIILVNPEKVATAGRLAQALGVDPQHITIFRDPTTTADVRVILGKNYRPCRR